MATMFRVVMPDGGPATVSTGVATYATCGINEMAVIIGDSVPRQRCGSELRVFLERWADQPKDPDTGVGATNRKIYVAAPGTSADQVTPSTTAQTTAPTETQWGIVVGDSAAPYLDRSNLLDAFVHRAQDAFVATLGL